MSDLWKRLYRELLEAEDRIAQLAERSGVSSEDVEAALDAAEERLTPDEEREDLYFASLRNFVEQLGGRLEVRVALGGESLVVRCEPGAHRRVEST